ncbi:MAG: Trm112 family protein [Brevefilum sp.]
MALNKDLLDILACPVCKGELDLLGQEEGLRCQACAVVYPIREEIPVMLPEEAVPQAAWDQGRREAEK